MPAPRDARLVDLATSTVLVTGGRGLVGSAVCRGLRAGGVARVLAPTSDELDLRDHQATDEYFRAHRPDVVVHAAARVGGILANATYPVEFLSENLRIQTSVLDAAHAVDVDRLLFLGSSCIYPRLAAQPITEDSLLTGPLEPTNEAYALAKITGVATVAAQRREYGRRWISAMPTNLYGPGDSFDLETSHVLPALLRRTHEAAVRTEERLTVWGTGTPRREFLHVDDLADACRFLLEHYDDDPPINVGTGSDITIGELAELVAEVVGFRGRLVFDPSRPDGTPRKMLDVSRLTALGWKPTTTLRDGLVGTHRWMVGQGVV